MIKAFSLASSPEPMFTIHMDGRVTFGPDYEPTEAAELFWSALTEHWKSNAELRAELDARDAAIADAIALLEANMDDSAYGVLRALSERGET